MILIVVAIFVTINNSNNNKSNISSTTSQKQTINSTASSNQDTPILIDIKARQKAIDFTLTDLNLIYINALTRSAIISESRRSVPRVHPNVILTLGYSFENIFISLGISAFKCTPSNKK